MIFKKKAKTKQISRIFEALSFMLSVGMTPLDGVNNLIQYGDKKIKPILYLLRDDLESGDDLSKSLYKNRETFGDSYYKQIEYGVKSGRLPETLQRIAFQILNKNKIKGKVRSALVYPGFVFILTMGIALFLFTNIIPQFADILSEIGDNKLPIFTVIIIGISQFIINHGILLIILTLSIIFLIRWLLKYPLKYKFHKLLVKLPLFGKLLLNTEYISFFQVLGDMVFSGAPTAESLEASASSIGNAYIKKDLMDCYNLMIDDGLDLSIALNSSKTIDGIDFQSVVIADRTGNLVDILQSLCLKKEAENEDTIKALLALLDPILMCMIGVVVGTILLAIYIPLFSMMNI